MQGAVEAFTAEVAAGGIFFAVADDDDNEIVFDFGRLANARPGCGECDKKK